MTVKSNSLKYVSQLFVTMIFTLRKFFINVTFQIQISDVKHLWVDYIVDCSYFHKITSDRHICSHNYHNSIKLIHKTIQLHILWLHSWKTRVVLIFMLQKMPLLILSTLLIARLSTRSSRYIFSSSRAFVSEQSIYGPMGQESSYKFLKLLILRYYMADSRFAPSPWETSLQSNAVAHWLGANLESALY